MKKTIILLAIAVVTLCSFTPKNGVSNSVSNCDSIAIDTTAVVNDYACPCHPLGDIYYYNCPCTHFDVYGNRIHAYDICEGLTPCVHVCVCY